MIHTNHETAKRKAKENQRIRPRKAVLATEFLHGSRPVLSLAFTVIFPTFLILQISI